MPNQSFVNIRIDFIMEPQRHSFIDLIGNTLAVATFLPSADLIQCTITIAVVNIPLRGITRPCGEWAACARCAEHSEGQYKDHDLRATVESATQDVVVLLVPSRVVPSEPYLRDNSYNDNHGDRRIRPCA